MSKNYRNAQSLSKMVALCIGVMLPAVLYAQKTPPMPTDLRQAFDNALYGILPHDSALHADNVANHFSIQFSGAQTTIDTGNGSPATLTLAAYGWGSTWHSAGTVTEVSSSGQRLTRQYGANLQEWFENSSRGLEQGFTLSQHEANAKGPVHIQLTTSKGWQPHSSPDGGIELTSGSTKIRYAGLQATDATGRGLASQMRALSAGIEIEVDDSDAVYPVTVDPAYTQQALLTGSDTATDNGDFGFAIALSADGNTALIGAFYKNSGTGAAYVFTRSSTGVWTQQQELTAPDGVAGDEFGISVALSGDGTTAIVGAQQIEPNVITNGAAYVFVRSGTTWNLQNEFFASDPAADDLFGNSVSLSTNGNTAVIGAPGSNMSGGVSTGAAYVFTRSGTSWSGGQKLTVSTSAADAQFGYSVALSGDAKTVLVGAYQPGSVYVYTQSGTTWVLQTNLTSSTDPYDLGRSLALSSDGNTALLGACYAPTPGAAFVFTRTGSQWTQQQELTISGTGYTSYAFLGCAVALSADGNTAVVGASGVGNVNAPGAAFVFGRSGTTWSLHQAILTPAAYDPFFGGAVALSGDASTALVYGLPGVYAYLFNATASAGPPTVVSVTPNAGSAVSQTFTGVYSDLNGFANFASVRMLFNSNVSAANACYISYYPSAKAMYLANDAGTASSLPVVPGSSTTVSNSQCTLSGKGSSYTVSGSTASLTVALTFTRTPPENIYLLATEINGTGSGWRQEGTWGATLGVPVPLSVSPDSGTGTSQIFSATYSDPNGSHDFATVRMLFNSTLSGTNACYVSYNRPANAIYLANDAGQIVSSPVTPGSNAQASNSQCTLSGTGSSYTANGNDATLDVSLAFTGITPQQKLAVPTAAAVQLGFFGNSVSLSADGNTALVGAWDTNTAGAAFVFTHSSTGWTEVQKFTPSNSADLFFGQSVMLSSDGNTALVGASNDIGGSGAAYIYVRSAKGWTQEQRFVAPSPMVGDQFGFSVALSSDGNTALIAAYGTNSAFGTNGQAYVYARSGTSWTLQQQLIPSNAVEFGSAVALSGDGNTALVGATGQNGLGGTNAVYAFTRSGTTWSLQQELTVTNAHSFGSTVALSTDGNTALIGDPGLIGANNTSLFPGAAYLFTRSGSAWTQQHEFTAVDSAVGDDFGSTVALANGGNTALVGAYDGDSFTGAAYLFNNSGGAWSQREFISFDATRNDAFGSSVALSAAGATALVGAPGKSNLTGATYAVTLNTGFIAGPTQNIYLEATENNGSSSGWTKQGTWTP